ncbi:uncharacterized protein LOC126614064 [Malus sylvestris]|uniref:uncharacterized protein LOC126614064 n=1 Tax=Malus sylvestris TaxID=3752 RepID=UPI0021ACF9CD|nr:uncharacterized protein LOC126614064 [Malus sylvestris]
MLMFFGISKVRFIVLLQIEHGTYIDKKCSFTGNVSTRGRILAGTCHSAKMNKTIIVRRNYLHYIKKYQRDIPTSGSCISMFPCEGRRPCYHRPVQVLEDT